MSESVDFLILGAGYTGSVLEKKLRMEFRDSTIVSTRRHQFDLSNRDSWRNLPKAKNVFWLFGAESLTATENFIHEKFSCFQNTVVLSSTGFFLASDGEEITEKSTINTELPRVQCEEKLRDSGASILHAAGIYGPNRNPLDWFRAGRIPNLYKWLNLIHVEDLSNFLVKTAHRNQKHERLIAADGSPQIWFNIVKNLLSTAEVSAQNLDRPIMGKKVQNTYSRELLRIDLQYPDVFTGLKLGVGV